MVDIAGEIKGLGHCAECRDEVLTLEELMYEQADIITLFIKLGYS